MKEDKVEMFCIINTKLDESTWGCPQGSAFGPLLWNIFRNDLTHDTSFMM